MGDQPISYCSSCSQELLAKWKGWPHKNAIPVLPRLEDGVCVECGGDQALNNSRITWFNFHNEYNAGLPDYWLLVVDGERIKWGKPYLGETKCTKCGSQAVLSEMNYPNGKRETKLNCSNCGILNSR
jgi:hypothetical protein